MARDSDKAVAFRSGAQSLRTMAATEPDREVALLMLSVAEDMERYAAELGKRFGAWLPPAASASQPSESGLRQREMTVDVSPAPSSPSVLVIP